MMMIMLVGTENLQSNTHPKPLYWGGEHEFSYLVSQSFIFGGDNGFGL
jgi:hypothetical protein